jgi:ATP-binding cassette subfamily B multidrug efflux pump
MSLPDAWPPRSCKRALAVRDTWMILADILVFVLIYFITIALVVGNFDAWLLAPFGVWLGLYMIAVWYFVPRLARVAQAQADARSLMTGRITDAYTNITTVKLFSHTQRESLYAKSAMAEFLSTVYRQMRMVTGFEIVNHVLSMVLIAGTGGAHAAGFGPGARWGSARWRRRPRWGCGSPAFRTG